MDAAWRSGWIAAIPIVLLAGALRLAHLGQVASDPFYDGAVKSMGMSWHNFFFGALEPSATASIDKPPLDLWLQVASVKLLGFGSTALKLPEALGGIAAVALLFAAIRRVFGVTAGLAAALALAVLPVAVITSRSDTMDSVMAALLILALLLSIRAGENGRTGWLLGAAIALGLAFNVKLLESVLAFPGLLAISYMILPGTRPKRFAQLGLAALVYVAVCLSWLSATLLAPAHDRPFAYGSTNGSAWNAAFVYNGRDRIEGREPVSQQPGFLRYHHYPEATQSERDHIPIPPAAATRLLDRIGPLSGERLGLELLAGLLLGLTALGATVLELRRAGPGPPDPPDHPDRPVESGPREASDLARRSRVLAGLLLWLLIGAVLFSHMTRLHPRYTEGFTPAVAAVFGVGVSWALTRRSIPRLLALALLLLIVVVYSERLLFGTPAVWWVTVVGAAGSLLLALLNRPIGPFGERGRRAGALALALVALLAIPLWASVHAVRANVTDSNSLGVVRPSELSALSSYLRAHQGSARYETAYDGASKIGSLVVHDGRPVLPLAATEASIVITPLARLKRLIDEGEVRYAILSVPCGSRTPQREPACSAPAKWIRAHATDVSRAAGLAKPKILWRLPEAVGSR